MSSLQQHRLVTAVAATTLAAIAGCMVGPNYHAPQAQVASCSYANTVPTTQTTAADQATLSTTRPSTVTAESEPAAAWWTTLRDPELDKLVSRASAGNLNLQRAASRLVESRATLREEGAKELPKLSNSDQFVRINSGQNVGFGSLGGSGSGTTGASSSSINANVWTAGLDATWEIDVFGGQRRTIEATAADYQASVEDRRDILVSLTAEVARDYLQLRGTQERLRIARQNLSLEQDTLGLTQSLRKAGFNSQLDVSRAMTQVAQTRAAIVPLTTIVAQQEHAIAVLLGMEPNALAAELDTPAPVPAVPTLVSVGMPADLLRRRPDIRRSERQIAAANARVGAAIADFYPKFSLTGDFGFDSTKFSNLFDTHSRFFILDPSISWRLFDFGKTAAEVDENKARTTQALLNYQGTVLDALRDVEDCAGGLRQRARPPRRPGRRRRFGARLGRHLPGAVQAGRDRLPASPRRPAAAADRARRPGPIRPDHRDQSGGLVQVPRRRVGAGGDERAAGHPQR